MAFLDIFYENLNFRKFENPKTLNRGGVKLNGDGLTKTQKMKTGRARLIRMKEYVSYV